MIWRWSGPPFPRSRSSHRRSSAIIGVFSETYNKNALAGAGIDFHFVQDNHSLSATKGTLRGLHCQILPLGQDKLVRVVRGAIFDVAVDLRTGSPTFGQYVSTVISAEDGAREVYEALESGRIDKTTKTITLEWYKELAKWHEIIKSVEMYGGIVEI